MDSTIVFRSMYTCIFVINICFFTRILSRKYVVKYNVFMAARIVAIYIFVQVCLRYTWVLFYIMYQSFQIAYDYILFKNIRGIFIVYCGRIYLRFFICKCVLCPECMYSTMCWCEMIMYMYYVICQF